jgi:hypothetical protein
MASKVMAMLDLVDSHPGLSVKIFSGLHPGLLYSLLVDPSQLAGTQLQ